MFTLTAMVLPSEIQMLNEWCFG